MNYVCEQQRRALHRAIPILDPNSSRVRVLEYTVRVRITVLLLHTEIYKCRNTALALIVRKEQLCFCDYCRLGWEELLPYITSTHRVLFIVEFGHFGQGLHISEDYGIEFSLSPQNAVFGALSL